MRKLVLLSFVIVASLQFCGAQSLDKMQWFNEPEQWEIKDKSLSMQVTPQSDYWRISHYGFTVDDAPFYYATYGGEFEVKVKITGDYKQRFDQAGLMLRINHENYIKDLRLERYHLRQSDPLCMDKSCPEIGRRGDLLLIR